MGCEVEAFNIYKAQDSSPAVLVDGCGFVADRALQHERDLVDTLSQRDTEAAVFDGEPAIGFAAFVVGFVKILSLCDELAVANEGSR